MEGNNNGGWYVWFEASSAAFAFVFMQLSKNNGTFRGVISLICFLQLIKSTHKSNNKSHIVKSNCWWLWGITIFYKFPAINSYSLVCVVKINNQAREKVLQFYNEEFSRHKISPFFFCRKLVKNFFHKLKLDDSLAVVFEEI